ncbi:MAG: TauD/TfdA family dioxygenase [Solimonas sp.]
MDLDQRWFRFPRAVRRHEEERQRPRVGRVRFPRVRGDQGDARLRHLNTAVRGGEGGDCAEGDRLLSERLAWTTRPENVHRHEWSVGDMLICDNTGALHRVGSYPIDSGRMMHRTTPMGEEALARARACREKLPVDIDPRTRTAPMKHPGRPISVDGGRVPA